jgi:predicted membrane protein
LESASLVLWPWFDKKIKSSKTQTKKSLTFPTCSTWIYSVGITGRQTTLHIVFSQMENSAQRKSKSSSSDGYYSRDQIHL